MSNENSNARAVQMLKEDGLFNAMSPTFQTKCSEWVSENGGTARDFLTHHRNNRMPFTGKLSDDPMFKSMNDSMQRQCRVWMEKNIGTPADFREERYICERRHNIMPTPTLGSVDGTIVPFSKEVVHDLNALEREVRPDDD